MSSIKTDLLTPLGPFNESGHGALHRPCLLETKEKYISNWVNSHFPTINRLKTHGSEISILTWLFWVLLLPDKNRIHPNSISLISNCIWPLSRALLTHPGLHVGEQILQLGQSDLGRGHELLHHGRCEYLSLFGKNICHLHDGEVAVTRGERLAAVELHLAPALLHASPQLAHVLLKLLHAEK